MTRHNACGTVTWVRQQSIQTSCAAIVNGNAAVWRFKDKNAGNFQFSTLQAHKKKYNRLCRVRNKQCIIYATNRMLQNEQSLNFTVPVSRCWMARNLLGERKENRKEGCEGRKTNKLQERKENYKIIQEWVRISGKTQSEIYRMHEENSVYIIYWESHVPLKRHTRLTGL